MSLEINNEASAKADISCLSFRSMNSALKDEAFLSLERDLLQKILEPKKSQKFIHSLSPYEKRWVENHLREELKLHSLLFIWKYGYRSYSEMSEGLQISFQTEMRDFLKGLILEQRRKRG